MKAAVVRDLASRYDQATLDAAGDALAEELAPPFPVEGDDDGERLTHLMLASRVRERMERDGEDLKGAFRAVMSGVRDVLSNSAD